MIIYKNKKLEIPVGLGPNFQEGSPEILNQNKTVDSSTFFQRVYPDPGFTGLGRVTINPYELDTKIIDSSTEMQVVTSDKDGLYRVVVNPFHLDFIALDSSTKSQTVRGAYDEIVVNPYTLDEKTVDSSTNPQVITSDEDGLSKVTIRPYVLSPLEVDSSTATQEITGQYGTVTVNPYVLDSSNAVITENGDYAFESSADGLSRVDVSVNFDTQPFYDEGYSAGESKGILEGIAQQKAKLDKTTFTSNGTYTREDGWNEVTVDTPVINNQDKVVDPSTNTQIITFDSGYTGIGKLTVNPYFLQKTDAGEAYVYTENDDNPGFFTVTPSDGYNGLGKVYIHYAGILYSKTFTPSTSEQTWDAQTDTNELKGLKQVVISPVTSSIDSNIAAGNIKRGISILGVTGTFDGGALQSKTIDSSTKSQTVTPSSGYYGLSSVVVNPYVLDSSNATITKNGDYSFESSADGLSRVDVSVRISGGPLQSKTIDSSTKSQTVTPSSGYYGLSSVVVNPYVLDSKTVDPSTNNITVTSSKDGLSSVTVTPVTSSIDSNIKAGNIRKDVTILGVTGTYEGGEDPGPVPVEYISNEGSLNLVFNSGYIPNDNTKIIARIAWGGEGQPGTGAWGNYFGVQDNFALREWGGYGSGEGQITWQLMGSPSTINNVYTTPGDLSIIRNIEVGNNYVKADSSTASSGKYSGHISDHPMFIFGSSDPNNGQLRELSSRVMRIHSFAIYERATLIKNLVPYQDASLNGCFFDTVSETYIYPLQGTPTVGPVAMYQQKVVDASLNAIEVTADAGFKALSKVTVNGVTSAVDPNITPGNIKAGVNILGVGGSFSGAIYHRIGYVANNSTEKKIFRNTGIVPTNNTRIEATVSFDDIGTDQGGYGYFWGTTSGAKFVVREMGGYGSRNVTYLDGNTISYYGSGMSSAPITYTHGQVENEYSFISYGGYIEKRSTWSHTWSTGDEIFIWAANKGNDTVDEYSSRVMRLYDFKIYEGDNLVFHGVPAADNEGACVLIDLVSNKMVEGEGTLTGGGVYVEPDTDNYIQNSQDYANRSDVYFDLGTTNYQELTSNDNVKEYIEIIADTQVPKAVQYLIGAGESVSRSRSVDIGQNAKGQLLYSGGEGNGSSDIVTSSFGAGMIKYTLMAYKNNTPDFAGKRACIFRNGVSVSTSVIEHDGHPAYNVGKNLYIFAYNEGGTVKQTCYGWTKIYQIKYYNTSDGEVHVLVPAYNNGQYCFHDLISDTYIYAAAGTPMGHIKDKYLPNNSAIDVYNG